MSGTEKSPTKALRTRTGTVVSTGGQKTIRVVIDHLVRHPRYGKYIRRRTKLAVHDPKDEAGLGDRVQITPCRPMSKSKSWRLVRVVRRAELPAKLS